MQDAGATALEASGSALKRGERTLNMDKQQALKKCDETLRLAAQHWKDKGARAYTAEMHSTACGLAMRQVFFPANGEAFEPTATNVADVFHALYNHSAWRQKFEKAGLFPKKEDRSAVSLMQELEEEFGE